MAGPAARALAFARALCADQHAVTLAAPQVKDLHDTGFRSCAYGGDPEALQAAARSAQIVVLQGMTAFHHPFLLDPAKIIVVDLYDPSFLENLAGFSDRAGREHDFDINLKVFQTQLLAGDYFVCANERQRDLWLGMLLTMGRINHLTCREDPTLRRLIDVVPFGLPEQPPVATAHGLRGVHPGIKPGDKIVLWGGGMWPWLDPLLAIQAMACLPADRQDIKLVFLSATLFGDALPQTDIVAQARSLSKQLGLSDERVIFNERWVPYESRQNYLLDANLGLVTHRLNLETYYSNRTRVLDYLWAGLPVVSVSGDWWSDVIEREGLGCVAAPDPAALAEAILEVADTPRAQYSQRMRTVAERYTWHKTTQALCSFCRNPAKAEDHDTAASRQWHENLQASAMQREMELREALAWHRLPLRTKILRRARKDLARLGIGSEPARLV